MASALDLAKDNYKRKKARFNEPPTDQPPLLEPNLATLGPSMEVRVPEVPYIIDFLSVLIRLRLDPLPQSLGNSWEAANPFLLQRGGHVERTADVRYVTDTNSQRYCAVCLL